MHRRTLLTGLAAAAALGARTARADAAPLRIGVLNDMSGVYSDYQGIGSVIGAELAAQDFGAPPAGRPVQILTADHQNKPDLGAAIARRWLDTEGVDMILDVPNSAVALAVSSVVREKNRVMIGSGAGTSDLTGTACSPNFVHWTYDTWEAGHALGRAVVGQGGKKWFFLTADYAFGHVLESSMADAVRAAGGEVLGQVRHPLGTADFSQYLVQAQSSGADVLGLANAGGDNTNTLKQAKEFGLSRTMRMAGPVVNINAPQALGLAAMGGILMVTPFYWDHDDACRAFARRFQARHPRHNMPNDMQAGCYSSTLVYLRTIATLGGRSDDGRAVVAAMKQAPVQDPLFGTTEIRADGRALHPVFLMQAKTPAESKGDWDFYKLISVLPPDQAWRPMQEGGCKLVG
ncbi:MAG: ABC transporter substrate-binding protein [Rhodospirillales bacterium]|nr:ABC transporter substrate-binding protein [Rhodospirillales bacterium]